MNIYDVNLNNDCIRVMEPRLKFSFYYQKIYCAIKFFDYESIFLLKCFDIHQRNLLLSFKTKYPTKCNYLICLNHKNRK